MKSRTIIRVDELAAELANASPDANLVIVDCRFSLANPDLGHSQYLAGHIPGAFYAHLDHDLAGEIRPDSGRHPLPDPGDFMGFVKSLGIDVKDTQVVVYDDANGAIAGRMWWMMKWIGHDRVAVLDGGLPAWERSGYETVQDVPDRLEVSSGYTPASNDLLWVNSETVNSQLSSDNAILLDARAPFRFAGEKEPIDPVAGHVPGACNMPFDGNLDGDGCFLPADELRDRFRFVSEALDNEKSVIHMCGSGVTACHNMLAMEIAGMDPGLLYVGSWSEWIRDPGREIATGSR